MRYNTEQYNLNFPFLPKMFGNEEVTYGEFFAGGLGCASAAKKCKNVNIRWVLNHDLVAIKTANFHLSDTKVYWSDIYAQDEHELELVDVIQASFECDMFTEARGNKPIDLKSYMMGWELYRYIKYLQPLVLTVENVPGVKNWSPIGQDGKPDKSKKGEEFERWKKAMMDLGYNYTESIRCAADDGIPTTRTRYFAIFYRDGLNCSFPEYTHNEFGTDGKQKWIACKEFIDLENTGESIFGRQFNENLPKQHRTPLKPNSLRRIGGGIKKYAPNFKQFISTYYGGNQGIDRGQSLEKPLATQTTENRHQLVTIEKMQFIADHCQVDFWQLLDEPLRSQLTWQTKQLVTIEQFVTQYYGTDQQQSIEKPLNTIPCVDRHQLVTIEKIQFISHYYNSGDKPESNVQSLDKPLKPILTENKAQLVTLLNDFDIKVRFLKSEELAEISTFERDFFSRKGLALSHKNAVKLIGNAVPPEWFFKILHHNLPEIINYKNKSISA